LESRAHDLRRATRGFIVFGSFRIGSILGITVRVHVLLVLLVILLLFSRSMDLADGLTLAFLGIILLLHELGHCLVARHFGIRVVDITLWPLGGMARMSAVPESSWIEGWIAIAGPAVNFALAAISAPIFLWLYATEGSRSLAAYLLSAFAGINVAMGVFNLIPVFPTDGGRVLRAFLARNGGWVRATERAVVVGRVIAVALAILGIVSGQWMLPLLALWLWWMGTQEVQAVRARHAPAPPPDPFAEFARRAAAGADPRATAQAEAFGRRAGSVAPDSPRSHRGFTAEDIERLEKFRGRLRPFDGGS
jgi:Zn-dependent protease